MPNRASLSHTALLFALFVFASLPSVAPAQWVTNGAPVCTQTGQQTAPAIASDGSDGAIMGWTDGRFGSATDIYAQRISPSGTFFWSGGGVAVCTASGAQSYVAMLPDFAHGATFFWSDGRTPLSGVYAQRLDASGLPLWALNGLALSTRDEVARQIMAIPDGSSASSRLRPISWPGPITTSHTTATRSASSA